MKKKYFILILSVVILISSNMSLAATLENTGFIPGQIWYSKDKLIEGETVNIYTAVWNSGNSSFSAKVEFYDKNVLLGTRDVTIPSLSLKEVSISWKVTSGDHLISAKIISPYVVSNSKKESISLTNNVTESNHQFVPVTIATVDGKPATSSDIIKDQINKANTTIGDSIPLSIKEPVQKNIGTLDSIRKNTLNKINISKEETKQKIDDILKKELSSKPISTSDATDKPIQYLKMFFLSALSFIFGSKLVFYFILVFIAFIIIRFIYRKIKRILV